MRDVSGYCETVPLARNRNPDSVLYYFGPYNIRETCSVPSTAFYRNQAEEI